MIHVFRLVKKSFSKLIFHFGKLTLELLPNQHICNLVRGRFYGLFLNSHGKNFAVASGVRLIMPSNLTVGDNVYIAHDCWVNSTGGLHLDNGVIISPKVVIATTKHRYENGRVHLRGGKLAPIFIGEGSWICSNTTVTMGVRIGCGCIVGANSVVTKDIPDYSFAAGQPAIMLKKIHGDDLV